ncbi:MAG: hypothetical protein LBS74_10005 [Oscillospiraceae bacterium]|jgi:preprotein translocase subunit SecD|nr:hypothetical protein [Oscillospiraceae bacterium]
MKLSKSICIIAAALCLVIALSSCKDFIREATMGDNISVTLEPESGVSPSSSDYDQAVTVIKARMNGLGYKNYTVKPNSVEKNIVVTVTYGKNEKIGADQPEKLASQLTAKSELLFVEGLPSGSVSKLFTGNEVIDELGNEYPIALTGADVSNAQLGISSKNNGIDNELRVDVTFNAQGAAKLAEVTKRLIGQTLSIWLDGKLVSAPTVNSTITEGHAIISGDFTADEATDLADQINSSALPFTLISRESSKSERL